MKLHRNTAGDHAEPEDTHGTAMADAARIFREQFPGITGADVLAHSDTPVMHELAAAVDELNRTGAR